MPNRARIGHEMRGPFARPVTFRSFIDSVGNGLISRPARQISMTKGVHIHVSTITMEPQGASRPLRQSWKKLEGCGNQGQSPIT